MSRPANILYYGDNLAIMQGKMALGSADLIYLDPPFNSNRNYNLMYRTITGKPIPEQVEAFFDTWTLDEEKEHIARSMPVLMRELGIPDYYVEFWRLWFQALKDARPELLAYLTYMVQRLLVMRGILKPTGTIYLHCDPNVSHYIKVMMDGIFGHDRFLGEIVWQRAQAKGDARRKFAWNHDVILAYAGGRQHKFNPVHSLKTEQYEERFDRDDDDGRGAYHSAPLDSPSPRPNLTYEYKGYEPPTKGWRVSREEMERLDADGRLIFPKSKEGRIRRKLYASEQAGPKVGDVWTDIPALQSGALRFGYPTQKPIPLVKRIIEASTDPGDTVFDPFCGCGTTIYAAHETHRKWVGCDIAILAVNLVRDWLQSHYRLSEGSDYKVEGIPAGVESAEHLARTDPFTFQTWFVERVGGFPTQKASADRGVDGRLYFEAGSKLHEVILSVKGGRMVRPTDVRDLRGTMEREPNAKMAALLSLAEPTKAMQREAADAGAYEYEGVRYPRIQFLTVRDLFVEKRELRTPTKVKTRMNTGQGSLSLLGGGARHRDSDLSDIPSG